MMITASHVALLVLCTVVLLLCTVSYGQGTASITLDDNGLTSLKFAGTDFLVNGDLLLKSARLENWDGTGVDVDVQGARVQVDNARQTVVGSYPFGSVTCAYAVQGNRLNLTVTVSNTSNRLLRALIIQPLALKFPATVTFDEGFRKSHNREEPPVIGLDYGQGKVVIANDEVAHPLYIGFPKDVDGTQAGASYPLLISNARNAIFPAKSTVYSQYWLDNPKIDRPVYPGQTDVYHISLRFGGQGATVVELAKDVYQHFAEAYPRTLKWADRRPIGMVFLGGNDLLKQNPYGWWPSIAAKADIHTPAGLAEFRRNLLAFADRDIRILKDHNCQGVIVWDLEGYEFTWGTYIGDPRTLTPDMTPVVDEFFARFRNAGLRVGLTLRPTYPGRMLYSNDGTQAQLLHPADMLNEKVEYAQKRWGCSLFYVDSNADYNEGDSHNEDAYLIMSADIFSSVTQKHPDVLLIPEQENTRYYAYTAPYNEVRQNYLTTPTYVQRVYPDAFSLIMVDAVDPKVLEQHHDELVAAVKRGDILLFNTYAVQTYDPNDVMHGIVAKIYKDAGK